MGLFQLVEEGGGLSTSPPLARGGGGGACLEMGQSEGSKEVREGARNGQGTNQQERGEEECTKRAGTEGGCLLGQQQQPVDVSACCEITHFTALQPTAFPAIT